MGEGEAWGGDWARHEPESAAYRTKYCVFIIKKRVVLMFHKSKTDMRAVSTLMVRFLAIVVSLFMAVSVVDAAAPSGPGIVKKKPVGGRYVSLPGGLYMVPYTAKIPGTTIEVEMVPIAGGKFKFGESGHEAGPVVEVVVEPFWMAKYETLWVHYDQFLGVYEPVKEAKLKIPKGKEDDAISIPTPLYAQEGVPIVKRMGGITGKLPVADITQLAAKQYTKWVSKLSGQFYRLPSEAEWEYAARAGSTTKFYWGNDEGGADDHAWYFDNSEFPCGEKGHPDFDAGYREVGKKKPNAWGLYDMAGNVSEWVLDQAIKGHRKKFAGKTVKWDQIIAWPTKEYPRVAKGGNWDTDAKGLNPAARIKSEKDWKEQDPQGPKSIWWHTEAFWLGFRIIRPLNVPEAKEQLKYWEPDIDTHREIIKKGKKAGKALAKDTIKAVKEAK